MENTLTLNDLAGLDNFATNFSRMEDKYMFARLKGTERPLKPLETPLRMACMTIMLCRHGSMDIELNMMPYHVRANTLLVIPPSMLIKTPGSDLSKLDLYVLFVSQDFLVDINIDLNNTHVPDGSNPDAAAACSEYDKIVAAAGYPDLQLLGIGNNGHIGFNEPDDHFSKGTHCVDLTESTIQANSRLFDSIDDVPRQAYTMGTQTIMYARMILVVANGEAKAQAVHDMCYGPVTPACPASILQLHTNCVVVADEAALSLCE